MKMLTLVTLVKYLFSRHHVGVETYEALLPTLRFIIDGCQPLLQATGKAPCITATREIDEVFKKNPRHCMRKALLLKC